MTVHPWPLSAEIWPNINLKLYLKTKEKKVNKTKYTKYEHDIGIQMVCDAMIWS